MTPPQNLHEAAPRAGKPLLQITDLDVAYGKAQVVHKASLQVHEGEFVALLGRNGAGKSTLLHAACSLIAKRSGTVHFAGSDMTHLPSEEVVKHALIQVLEGHRIFQNLSVEDNILMGTYAKNHRGDRSKLENIYALFPELWDHRFKLGSQLSGGQQQILAVAQGVIAEPRLLILDEPSSGLAPMVIDRILRVTHDLCSQGVAILLVEQLVDKALQYADYVYLLEAGSVVAQGTAEEMRNSEVIKHVYLGAS
jgi:branched-chain amino acid transport system ATP-binding protein